MTLGEFRQITERLSDYTEFVTKEGKPVDYAVDIETSYFRLGNDEKMVPVEESVCLIPVLVRTKVEGTDGDGQTD
ncbi:MAG: hypothetical protein VB096_05890 [Pseudoflavonifractor sp.]|nr:hypothetical protein [Pseudoflavonifractor sp.]